MKKKVLITGLMMATMLTISACGGQDSTETATTAVTTTADAATTEEITTSDDAATEESTSDEEMTDETTTADETKIDEANSAAEIKTDGAAALEPADKTDEADFVAIDE